MSPSSPNKPNGHHGKLAIPLPFEDAIRAALEVKPPPKPPRKKREPKKGTARAKAEEVVP